jgi:hypothetical protein
MFSLLQGCGWVAALVSGRSRLVSDRGRKVLALADSSILPRAARVAIIVEKDVARAEGRVGNSAHPDGVGMGSRQRLSDRQLRSH